MDVFLDAKIDENVKKKEKKVKLRIEKIYEVACYGGFRIMSYRISLGGYLLTLLISLD